MRHRRIAALLALASLLAGPAVATCVAIEVHAGGLLFADGFESGDTSVWGSIRPGPPRFSATRTLDLDLEVRFAEGFAGDHLLRLKLLTPKGHHYQTLSLPIAFEAAKRAAARHVAGYPRPLAVRLAAATPAGSPAVAVALPVGGTTIVWSSLYGLWTAEAYLDDEIEACAVAVFILYP